MTIQKHNIILVDDHKMFLDGLKSILNPSEDLHIVLSSNSAAQVVKYLNINKDENIALVVTDVNMPDMNGIQLNAHIKKEHPKIKTLVVSMQHDTDTILKLTEDDVDGYVTKNAEKKELLLAIKTIVHGEKYFSKSIKEKYMQSMFDRKKSNQIKLTNREKEVLRLIALEHTTQEIADILFLSKHTIESYRKNLISKLDVRNLAGLTKKALKLGLIDT